MSSGVHTAPSLTEISLAERSLGRAFSKASTLTIKSSGSASAASFASLNFSRTLPERYSSAARYFSSVLSSLHLWFKKIIPLRSSTTSSSVLLQSCAIKPMSTFAFSPIDIPRASTDVSAFAIFLCGFIVRLWKISAFRFRLPSSFKISSAVSRKYELSSEKAELFALLVIRPYFFVKLSYKLFNRSCSSLINDSG